MIFFKLAIQNMRKHFKRTLVILLAVTVSVTVLLVVSGMMEGMKKSFYRNMLQEDGHVQIQNAKQREALNPYDLKLLLPDGDRMLADLKKMDDVAAAEKILTFGGILLANDKNLTITGCGVSADTVFFAKARKGLVSGQFLDAGGKPGIAISTQIARLLGVSSGDPVVVLVEDSSGSPWYVEYPVSSIFETDSRDFDGAYFFIDHSEAETLLYVPGQTREIRVLLKDMNKADALVAELRNDPFFGKDTEIRGWREIQGSYLVLLSLFDFSIVIINIFTVVVVATVITNSILMNVFEHTREYGTLRAIGMKKKQLFMLIMTEGFVQGLTGSVLGLAVGIPIVLYYQAYGLNWGAISESLGLGKAFFFAFNPVYAFSSLVTGILIACAGSLYAGVVSVRTSIIDCLGTT